MSNYLKNWKVIISVVLAILTAIMLPVEVFAQAAPKHNPSAKVKFDSLAESEDVGEIVAELKERRDEYTKHFRMDDGTIMAVVYDVPVHYKNKKGKWIDYDNTLVSESTASPDEASQVFYSNKKSKLDIDFTSETSGDNLITLNSSKGSISWEYTDAKKSTIKIDKSKKHLRGNDRFTSIDKLSSKASYKSIYDKVNLDCIVSSVGIKENIILQDKSAQNEFNIEYNIKGFTAKQTDKQTIKLYKDKKAIYTISAPCMYDADKKTNTNLELKITKNKDDKLSVKLTADKEFLNNAKYPVTIDPEVNLFGSSNIQTSDVSIDHPDTAYGNFSYISIGSIDNSNYIGLIKCSTLQSLFSEKNIVSAKMKLTPINETPEMEIEAHPITTNWSYSNVTYNSLNYNTEVIDYTKAKNNSADKISFDITKYAKKWAYGETNNYGLCLISNDTGTTFGGAENANAKRAFFEIKYKEYTGLEGNLTSHTIPCGQDAVLSVCDYTGSLSVRQSFFEENTARLPLSIYATYHSVRNAVNEQTGYGWHYSFNQTVSKDNNYYKYIDADGVDHYFKRESNNNNQDEELYDEDNLGLSLKRDHTTDKITIDNDSITQNYQIVDNSGIYKLKNEKSNDNENNTISYKYNSAGYLTKITTSLGEYNITRDSGNYICRINTPDNKRMYFVYYSAPSRIARFTAIDGKATNFYYTNESENKKIKEVRCYNESGAALGGGATCNYDGNKVSSISELGKNGASRKALSVTYNDDNTTEFKTLENNTVNNNKKETYTFDNYGNTVSVLNANGMITNANDSSSLSINTGSDSYTKNYIEESNEPNGIGNRQGDGLYFYRGDGTIGNQTSSGGQVTLDSETYLLGHNSIKVNHSGESQIYTYAMHENDIGTLAGKTVTLSAYVKLSNITAGNLSGGAGAIVKFKCLNGNTTLSDKNSIALTQTVKGSEWERLSLTVSIPQATTKFRMYFGIRNAQGTAWFDCMQLEKGSVANDYNALSNSDFSSTSNWKTQDDNTITVNDQKAMINGSGGEPSPTEETTSAEPDSTTSTQETTEEPNVETYTAIETETILNDVVEEKNTHGNVVKTEQGFVTRTYKRTYEVNNNATEPEETSTAPESSGDEGNEPQTISCNKYIYQEVPVNKKDVSFVISGSAKANSVPLNSEYRTFGIALKIKYDGDAGYTEDHYQAFNACVDSMQNISLSVTPNDSERVVESVAFAFVYGYNKNKMEIKNAMLNLAYNGVSQEQPSTTETTEPETTDPEATNPSVTDTTAEPETTEAVVSEPENEDTLLDEEITTESVNTDDEYMRTQATYDPNGNYITAEIDEAGNTTEYERDHDGNATKITDGKGHSTSYSYDVHNNLLSVTAVDENTTYSNTYTYNSYNELSKTTHHGFDYNYTYNNYGEPTSVKVGSQALITYTYNNYGNVSNATYGNGYSLDYHYDDYGRITSVTTEANNNTVTLASYKYNKKNQVTKFTDGKSGETTEYCYDCNGNTLYKYLISEDGELLRVVEGDTEKTTVNGSMRTITSGTDDSGKSYVQNGNAKITSDTDDFGRTTKINTKLGNNPKFSVNYTYQNVVDENNQTTYRTTNKVDEMTYKLGEGENAAQIVKYKYTYDKNGNIKTIKENGISKYVYTYDSLNQLIHVADAAQYYQFEFTYDNAGNITEKRAIKSNPGGGNEGTTTVEYEYTDSTWGDLLTKYDGQTLTYDNIGNPTSYRDGMTMSWSGRELQSISKNNNTYSFTYNLDGLRTKKQKNNDSIVNYYYDDSNNLIGLKKGNTTVLFYYDSEGSLYSMSKGDDTYFFIKDLQGDIRKIIDEEGTVVATYAYDAWGALLAENEDSEVEGYNPFRYRGYVYDNETELYYLQSRYYDPKTGRFINADDSAYTDTYSGSPLSTNMFAYCENNAVNGEDPSGNWDVSVHQEINFSAGFSLATIMWSKLPDEICESDKYYSAPFHSRSKKTKNGKIVVHDGLQCAKYMYNKAIGLKNQYHKGNKNRVTFKYSEKKGVQNFKKAYMGFVEKDKNGHLTNTVSTNCTQAKNLTSRLNKIGDRNKQAEAMLGLALHTIQDYYAHRVQVKAELYNKNNKKGKELIGRYSKSSITRLNTTIGWHNTLLEDRVSILPWRIDYTKSITYEIFSNYCQNKKISKIVLNRGEFNEKPLSYHKTEKSPYIIKLWYIPCKIKITWKS